MNRRREAAEAKRVGDADGGLLDPHRVDVQEEVGQRRTSCNLVVGRQAVPEDGAPELRYKRANGICLVRVALIDRDPSFD